MKTRSFFLFFALLFLFLLAPSAYAVDTLTFHFQQSMDRLRFDPQFSQPVTAGNDPDFSIVDFSGEKTAGAYRLELIDVTDAVAVKKWFNGQEGAFSYVVPRFGIVKGYKIYLSKDNTLILEGSLEQFARCNANGICEYEKGENLDTCLADCVSGSFSDETKKLLAQNNDILKDPKTGEILLRGPKAIAAGTGSLGVAPSEGGNTAVLVILLAFCAVIGTFVIVIFRIRKRNRRYGL